MKSNLLYYNIYEVKCILLLSFVKLKMLDSMGFFYPARYLISQKRQFMRFEFLYIRVSDITNVVKGLGICYRLLIRYRLAVFAQMVITK